MSRPRVHRRSEEWPRRGHFFVRCPGRAARCLRRSIEPEIAPVYERAGCMNTPPAVTHRGAGQGQRPVQERIERSIRIQRISASVGSPAVASNGPTSSRRQNHLIANLESRTQGKNVADQMYYFEIRPAIFEFKMTIFSTDSNAFLWLVFQRGNLFVYHPVPSPRSKTFNPDESGQQIRRLQTTLQDQTRLSLS